MSQTPPKARQTAPPIPREKLARVLAVLGDPAYRGKLALAKLDEIQRRILRTPIQRQKAEA